MVTHQTEKWISYQAVVVGIGKVRRCHARQLGVAVHAALLLLLLLFLQLLIAEGVVVVATCV